jgi:hypothetical protein
MGNSKNRRWKTTYHANVGQKEDYTRYDIKDDLATDDAYYRQEICPLFRRHKADEDDDNDN